MPIPIEPDERQRDIQEAVKDKLPEVKDLAWEVDLDFFKEERNFYHLIITTHGGKRVVQGLTWRAVYDDYFTADEAAHVIASKLKPFME